MSCTQRLTVTKSDVALVGETRYILSDVNSDSMIQSQMDRDRFKNIGNLDLVKLNQIRDSIHACIC